MRTSGTDETTRHLERTAVINFNYDDYYYPMEDARAVLEALKPTDKDVRLLTEG